MNREIETYTASELGAAVAKGQLGRAIIIPGSDLIEATIQTVVALGYATEAELREYFAGQTCPNRREGTRRCNCKVCRVRRREAMP
jgi:hypothetical protein